MKIALISPNTANLQAMATVLASHGHRVASTEGGKGKMRGIAEQDAPDLMVVEGMCCDPDELTHVEYVCSHFPDMAVVLLCATQTSDFLIQAMRTGVREVLPSPAAVDALIAMTVRVEAKLRGPQRSGQGQVLGFVSCKGGSGATFLATNLGYQLAEQGSVLLVDLNMQFGDALGLMHDGSPASTVVDVARNVARLDATLLAASAVNISPNYGILAAPDDPAQAIEVKPEHVDAILDLAARHYDFVLLDLPRTIDPLTIRALDRAHRVHIVMQQTLPALRNARHLLAAFDALGYAHDKTELLVNRFDKSSTIGLPELRKALGERNVRTVPNAWREVSACVDQGMAISRSGRANAVARTIGEMAAALRPARAEPRSLLDRLLKRA